MCGALHVMGKQQPLGALDPAGDPVAREGLVHGLPEPLAQQGVTYPKLCGDIGEGITTVGGIIHAAASQGDKVVPAAMGQGWIQPVKQLRKDLDQGGQQQPTAGMAGGVTCL